MSTIWRGDGDEFFGTYDSGRDESTMLRFDDADIFSRESADERVEFGMQSTIDTATATSPSGQTIEAVYFDDWVEDAVGAVDAVKLKTQSTGLSGHTIAAATTDDSFYDDAHSSRPDTGVVVKDYG